MSIVSLYHHEMIGVIRFDWFLYPQYYGVRLVLSPQCYDLIGFVPFYTPSIVIRLVWFLCPQFDFTSEKSLPRLCTPLWLLPQLLHLCQVNGEGDLRIPFWSGQKIWYLTCVSVFMCIHIPACVCIYIYVWIICAIFCMCHLHTYACTFYEHTKSTIQITNLHPKFIPLGSTQIQLSHAVTCDKMTGPMIFRKA